MTAGVEHFAHPEWILPLSWLLLLAAAALAAARWRARRRRVRLLGDPRRPPANALESDAALLLALAAIALALVAPRIGERTLRVPATGVDVVFALDVSRSMDARDVPPSRLDRARRAAGELLERLAPGDRAALVAFAGRGVLLTPLTPDRDALRELLSGLDTDLIRPPDSDVAAGVRAALDAFEPASGRPALVFVLGDGEDPQHRRDLGGEHARRAGVRVLAAALGSDAGATIPDHGVPLRDAAGAVVVSRRRAQRLEALTSATGGELFRADAWGRFDFDAAVRSLRRDAAGAPGQWVERRVRAARVAPFALLAFAVLLLEGLPRPARGPGRGGRGRLAAAAAAIALTAAARPASPPDARSLIELGVERLERGERAAAARAFTAAALGARDPALAALAYYDLGVAELERGELEAARGAFFDALALAPGDREARFNLEWTLQALARRPPPRAPSRPEPETASPPPGADRRAPEASPPEPTEREPETGTARGEPAPVEPQPLEPERRQHWRARIGDDPSLALRSAVEGDAPPAGRPAGPAW